MCQCMELEYSSRLDDKQTIPHCIHKAPAFLPLTFVFNLKPSSEHHHLETQLSKAYDVGRQHF